MRRKIVFLVLFMMVVGGSGIVGGLLYKNMSDAKKTSHMITVEKLDKMGKLELVRINIKDVLEQTVERPFHLPNAKAVLIIAGEVIAGIDLEKVRQGDIEYAETRVTVTLPEPEILMSKINHEKSRVYNVEWGGFTTADLVDEAYKNAELAIVEEVGKMGYEETCRNNAKALLTPLFQELSGKEVVILFRD